MSVYRPEAACDVIFGVTAELVGIDICAKFDNRLFGQPDPFYGLLCNIQLHFAADRKQLLTSYPADAWAR